MVKIGYNNVYFWDERERIEHNTERHQVFREELYPCARLPREEFLEKFVEFKKNNPDLI